jgi:effector-binding domain-containing protein
MAYDVRIENVTSRPLAVVRRCARQQELSNVVPECCGLVWNVIRSQQVPGAGCHIAIYYDDKINLEVGVELEAPFAGYGEVIGSSTPAGRAATITHFGPYQLLCNAHDAIHQWCQDNGWKFAGPSWEIYGHWLDEWNRDPSKIRTDVYYRIV